MANISSGNRGATARTSKNTRIRLDPKDMDKTLAIWKGLFWELLQLKCNQVLSHHNRLKESPHKKAGLLHESQRRRGRTEAYRKTHTG